jgi:hypothetical protein
LKNFTPYIFPVIFIGILILPITNSLFKFKEFERTNENRQFRDSIQFNIQNLDPLPSQINDLFNDNFSFRTPLLEAYHWNKYYTFKISPHPEKTIIGQNGWFFMAQEELKIYEGKKEFTTDQLNQFDQVWDYRKKFLDSLNITSYWVIGPMKHYVYPEHLPFNVVKKKGKSRVEILTDRINKKYPDFIINPLTHLQLCKDSVDLYFKLDNHWNRRAGFYIANIILEKIKQTYPHIQLASKSDYYWVDSLYYSGFHRDVVGIKSLQEQDYFPTPKNEKALPSEKYNFPVTEGFGYPGEFEKVYRDTNNISQLKLLVIRDSFADLIIPFLKEPFHESVFIFDGWNYGLNKEIIQNIKPDIVIFLGLETHLEHYINR